MIRSGALWLTVPALCGVIAWEIAAAPPTLPDMPDRPAAVSTAPGQVRTHPERDIAGQLRQVLARPVFSPSRRPSADSHQGVAGLTRLSGIIVDGSHKTAIFAGLSGGRPVTVETGGHIGAYEVKDVAGDGITLMGPDGVTVLAPAFDPAAPATSKPPALNRVEPLKRQTK